MAAPYNQGNGNGSGQAHPRRATRGILADRLPPQNIEAEQGVLGSILLDNDVLHEVVPLLRVEDFYRDTHQIIYRAIRDLYDLGKPIDAIIAGRRADRRDQFKVIGGDGDPGRDPRQRPARRQRQVLRRDRPPEGDQPPVDRERQRDPPRRLLEQLHGRANCSNRPSGRSSASPRTRPRARRSSSRTSSTEAMDRIAARAESRHPVTGVGDGLSSSSTTSPAASSPSSSSSWPPGRAWARPRWR